MLDRLFEKMGFPRVARHRSKDVTLYRQGDINFIVNPSRAALAPLLRRRARPVGAARMAFRVRDAHQAYERALSLGAQPIEHADRPDGARDCRRSRASAARRIYLIDRYGAKGSIYDIDFELLGERDPTPEGHGLWLIDHLTHNVYRGRMDDWAGFYERSSTSARSATSTSRASTPASLAAR